MCIRHLTHVLILALFLTSGILATYVSPASASMARDAAGVEQTMEAGMPCCPSDRYGSMDCATTCPALTFCLTKCSTGGTSRFVALPRPALTVVDLKGDDAERTSQSLAPPARPPRI